MRPAPARQPGGSCGRNAGEGPPAPVGYPGHGVTAPATGGGAARAVEAVGGGVPPWRAASGAAAGLRS